MGKHVVACPEKHSILSALIIPSPLLLAVDSLDTCRVAEGRDSLKTAPEL